MWTNLGDLIDPSKPGDAIAIVDCSKPGDPSTSYAELSAQIQACARGLQRAGLQRGDAVALLGANRAEYLVAYLAIMWAGMVAVPVNTKLAKETLAFILDDCQAKLAFVDAARQPLVPAAVRTVCFDGAEWAAFQDAGTLAPVAVAPDDCAMVLYTSGSTGRPKGVLLSHHGQLWTVQARFKVRTSYEDECFIAAAPLFHMNALTNCKFALAAHAKLVLMPQFEALAFIAALERHQVTWITSVPTMMAMVVREEAALAQVKTERVNFVRMGSAPATEQLYQAVARAFPNATLAGGYGTTEAGPIVFGPTQGRKVPPGGGLGWPLPGVEVRLVDKQGLDAEEGELWMRTPANLLGYLNLPEQTRKVLTPDRWYLSGDVFRRAADGCYHFVGRVDDMFNCGGENIYPGEVEQVIEKMPQVMQAAVVPVPDELKGHKPVAFIVIKPGTEIDENLVKQFVLDHAPAYQHPRRVFFVEALPLAATNKVDRKLLQQRAAELMTVNSSSVLDSL
jgi:long-chain acyl-CoA synthetase